MRAPTQRRGELTRDKLLDTAEQLFARRGFDGVSIRDITSAAGVDVSLANYHFGSKERFFDAVIERRAEQMNTRRMAMLEDAVTKASPAQPSLEEVIGAFMWPVAEIMMDGGAGGRAYGALIAQVNTSPHMARAKMGQFFDPVVREFLNVLQRSLPHCGAAELYWSFHFLSGALTLSMAETGRIDALSNGLCKSEDLQSVFERMVPFCAAGFRAACRVRP